MNFRRGKYKVLTEPLMGADKPNLDQELELSSEEVAFDIDVKDKRDYGGEEEEGHLQQRKCSREMRHQQRGNMKISGAILGKYKMS